MSLKDYKHLRDSTNANDLIAFLGSIESGSTTLAGSDKSEFMNELLSDLDKSPETWNEQVTTRAIQTLKFLGRDMNDADPLFSERGMRILLKLGGLLDGCEDRDTTSTREALKCLSNCILLKDATKTWVIQHGGVSACFHLLALPELSMESQFLTCRILFFMTVNGQEIVEQLMALNIAPALTQVLVPHVNNVLHSETIDTASSPINPISVISEALKLLFNLLLVENRRDEAKEDEIGQYFSSCLPPIFDLLFVWKLHKPMPLVAPVNYAIQALMQYPYSAMRNVWKTYARETFKPAPGEGTREIAATRLMDFVEYSLKYLIPTGDPDNLGSMAKEHNADAALAPLLLVIHKLAANDSTFADHFKLRMLPSEIDREKPVNIGDSMPATLIRLMTSTMLSQTREAVSECLFSLCNDDASEFSQQVGYGNAIGFLVNRGIAVEPPQGEADASNKVINPITGQYVDAESREGPSLADMTDEEKEREAERLFVLFERLKKTGVIDVENPVAKAMREGRLQEISSDDEGDSDKE